MWGDVAPDTITFEMMSKWRSALETKHGRDVAHKTLRVWRTLAAMVRRRIQVANSCMSAFGGKADVG